MIVSMVVGSGGDVIHGSLRRMLSTLLTNSAKEKPLGLGGVIKFPFLLVASAFMRDG